MNDYVLFQTYPEQYCGEYNLGPANGPPGLAWQYSSTDRLVVSRCRGKIDQ